MYIFKPQGLGVSEVGRSAVCIVRYLNASVHIHVHENVYLHFTKRIGDKI